MREIAGSFKRTELQQEIHKDSLFSISRELGDQELIQKPKYIANTFAEVFRSCLRSQEPFPNPKQLSRFYKKSK